MVKIHSWVFTFGHTTKQILDVLVLMFRKISQAVAPEAVVIVFTQRYVKKAPSVVGKQTTGVPPVH